MTSGTAMGHAVVRVGRDTASLGISVDGRFVRRVAVPRSPRSIKVELPWGFHTLRVRARNAAGARWSRSVPLWVLPESSRRAKGIGGRTDRRLQRDLVALTARVPATTGFYVQHLVTGCGAAVNAGARFPAASTLKAAILLDVQRRSKGTPSAAMNRLLDEMIIESNDLAANRVLEIQGGGSGVTGADRVTATMRAMGLRDSLIRRPYIIEPAERQGGTPIPVDTTAQPQLLTNFISTPYELGRIMVAIHRGMRGGGPLPRVGVRSAAIRTGVVPRLLSVRDRTKLVAGVPDGILVAHKTGYNTNVKHDAGIVYLRSGPVVVVAMSWSASGVSDAVGDRFVADVARAAVARLRTGGKCR
jgi:beta-lactamase class A